MVGLVMCVALYAMDYDAIRTLNSADQSGLRLCCTSVSGSSEVQLLCEDSKLLIDSTFAMYCM